MSPNPPTSPSLSSDEKSLYTWTTFFSLVSGRASTQEIQAYNSARDTLYESSDRAKCEKTVSWLLEYSPVIRFLRSKINQLGPDHDINSDNIFCRKCDSDKGGGFEPDYGILICANKIRTRGRVEDTLAHEMVHAYDYLRFKVRDPEDLRHAACTEIRASTLSGECRFIREFFTRGQRNITQQLQECVRRRATLSVMARPNCKDREHAEKVVGEVWKSCFYDTRPFDEIYR